VKRLEILAPRDKDLLLLALLALAVFVRFAPTWARGLTSFWGDLTYLQHPWRAFDAETLQAGRLPLWNPYLYFGMPAAATMQDSLFYPGTLPFFFCGFAAALLVYHFLEYWLCAALSYLWLRSWRLSRGAALAGCVSLSWGGVMLSRMPFLNHLAVLALAPAFFLFFRRPLLLSLALALAFLAGYPAFLVGAALLAWILAVIFIRRARRLNLLKDAWSWSRAAAGAMALSGCLLLPAWQLLSLSPRAHGLKYADIFRFQFSPADLRQWVSPWLVPWPAFNPAVEWWKCCYVGFLGWAAALWGLWTLPRRKAAGLAAVLLAIGLLILGNSNPVSTFLWRHGGLLRFIRYPGNLDYLAAFALCPLIALGAQRCPRRGLAAAALWLELSLCGLHAFPLAPRGLFTSAGPLVRRLQNDLHGDRYLLSPKTLELDRGLSYSDWKHRLYGLTNAPYHLAAAGNFGDPLSPRANFAFMNLLYTRASAGAAAALFPWAGIADLVTGKKLPPTGLLLPQGRTLWRVYAARRKISLAYFFDEKDGANIPKNLAAPAMPRTAKPVAWRNPDGGDFEAAGKSSAPGWLFVSWPRYPGWRARLVTPAGAAAAAMVPALELFQKTRVPAGAWTLRLRYDPASFRWGLWLSLGSVILMALAAALRLREALRAN